MEYEHESRVWSFISGLLLGATIGAGVALITAPESGRRTRRRIRRAADDIKSTATDRWEDLSVDVRAKVDDAIRGTRGKIVS